MIDEGKSEDGERNDVASLTDESESALLNRWADIMAELKRRGILRSANNPVADYAEYVVAERLHLTLATNSTAGHDAVDEDNVRYQTKARRLSSSPGSRQLSPIRNIDRDSFDFPIVALFDHGFTLVELWKLPIDLVREHGRHSQHVNGRVILAKGAILQDARAIRLV